MPVYRCPNCGREIVKPEGTYYCKSCGPEHAMMEAGSGVEKYLAEMDRIDEEMFSAIEKCGEKATYDDFLKCIEAKLSSYERRMKDLIVRAKRKLPPYEYAQVEAEVNKRIEAMSGTVALTLAYATATSITQAIKAIKE